MQHKCKSKCMNFATGCCWCQKFTNRRVYIDGIGLFSPLLYKHLDIKVRRDIYFCSQCALITFPERDNIVKEINDYIIQCNKIIEDFKHLIYSSNMPHEVVKSNRTRVDNFTHHLVYGDQDYKDSGFYNNNYSIKDIINRVNEAKMTRLLFSSKKYIAK